MIKWLTHKEDIATLNVHSASRASKTPRTDRTRRNGQPAVTVEDFSIPLRDM